MILNHYVITCIMNMTRGGTYIKNSMDERIEKTEFHPLRDIYLCETICPRTCTI